MGGHNKMKCTVCKNPTDKLFLARLQDDDKKALKWVHEIKICKVCRDRILQYIDYINKKVIKKVNKKIDII